LDFQIVNTYSTVATDVEQTVSYSNQKLRGCQEKFAERYGWAARDGLIYSIVNSSTSLLIRQTRCHPVEAWQTRLLKCQE
jgi:hypothetical protein